MDFSSVDKIPVFMAATPDFVEKSADTAVAYLKAWRMQRAASRRARRRSAT
jgi:hypothetical protein